MGENLDMIQGMESAISRVASALKNEGVEQNVPLSMLTSFHIGGNAALVVRPGSEEALLFALSAMCAEGCLYHVLGNGTNVLAPDEGFAGAIVRVDREWAAPRFWGTLVTADAGMRLSRLVDAVLDAGLMGLESLCGIPGTVGGAVAMNAGAYGALISDYIKSVRILCGGRVYEEKTKPSDFGQRRSRFAAPDVVVLAATFKLPRDDGTARKRLDECTAMRCEKQPLAYPSAGSVFKRPEGHYAGGLIERCRLKGVRVGDAEVSCQHAGFIINRGAATEHDVLELIALVQKRVFDETGVRLERELKRLCEV